MLLVDFLLSLWAFQFSFLAFSSSFLLYFLFLFVYKVLFSFVAPSRQGIVIRRPGVGGTGSCYCRHCRDSWLPLSSSIVRRVQLHLHRRRPSFLWVMRQTRSLAIVFTPPTTRQLSRPRNPGSMPPGLDATITRWQQGYELFSIRQWY